MNSKKRCTQCKKYFRAETMFFTNVGTFCENTCRIKWATQNTEKLIRKTQIQREKAERKERVAKKKELEELESIAKIEARVQKVFNEYIRLRDAKEPCFTCEKYHNGQYHAGHYLTVGAHPELRFEELNAHKQCSVCNNYHSGNTGNYRKKLVKKYGVEKVEWLEGPHSKVKRTREELEEIKQYYKKKLKKLKSDRDNEG